ncbi:MAG: DUF2892 domain-containing protein [Hydrogenophilus sp.]|nr:DUF2892 domain-containing protein [Hydrogenophilus sp.]
MQTNVGGIDKISRIAVGALLILLAIMGIGTPWTWIGVIPLVTGLIGFCPLYILLGINTAAPKDNQTPGTSS